MLAYGIWVRVGLVRNILCLAQIGSFVLRKMGSRRCRGDVREFRSVFGALPVSIGDGRYCCLRGGL